MKGDEENNQRVDSWVKPDAENFDIISGSPDKYSPAEFKVGFAILTDEIPLPFTLPAGATVTNNGDAVAALDIPNNKIIVTTAGVLRDIVISEAPTSGATNPDGSQMLNPDGSTAADPA
jgi:hypothetical protein